ncbi:hypothetical protein Mgra_00004205 [Meloidogyne graminicola]|uniref:Uncharacterized protein n=1 Tax=Meloidogyne graminicola TaxID=189291 RepID=A0A8S9ZT35_9BILA|nr:hypothetical protein Mgra_00004205 [Meloidogyne graminicola]
MFSLLSFLLIGHLSLITNANRLRHSLVNKQFIDQLAEGSYEIIHPFQLRDGERMGIDTREYFLNTTTIQHSRQVRFVLRSSVLLHQRLRISLNLNEHLLNEKSQEIIFNKSTHFTLEDSEQNNIESIKLENIENCYYQGMKEKKKTIILKKKMKKKKIILEQLNLDKCPVGEKKNVKEKQIKEFMMLYKELLKQMRFFFKWGF